MRNLRNSQYITQVEERKLSEMSELVPEVGALIYVDDILYIGDGVNWNRLYTSLASGTNIGLYAQTANSTAVTNTTTETTLLDGGVGSLTVPANGFKVGDSFAVEMGGHISSQNNNTLRIKIKSGSVILGDTGLITMPSTTDKHWDLNLRFTIRTLGAAGVASIASFGLFTYSKNASNAFEGSDFSIINNTSFDTTISNTLGITAQWGTASTSNSIYSESFILNKIY